MLAVILVKRSYKYVKPMTQIYFVLTWYNIKYEYYII